MSEASEPLIITGSFNGLMDRIARVPFFDVWFHLKTLVKRVKKQETEPAISIAEALTLTGLLKEDVELFVSLGLVSIIHGEENPLLSVRDVLSLVQIFEPFAMEE